MTALGIVNEVSPLHQENALSPMAFSEFGIVNEVSFTHLLNAPFPMEVTVSGMQYDVWVEQ